MKIKSQDSFKLLSLLVYPSYAQCFHGERYKCNFYSYVNDLYTGWKLAEKMQSSSLYAACLKNSLSYVFTDEKGKRSLVCISQSQDVE